MKIFSKYQDCLEGMKRGEIPNKSTSYYVDCVGFISMEQQIRGLINAGINLENYRRSQYDYQTNNENIDIDDVEVSAENTPEFMPSVDMPHIVDSMIDSITSPAPSPEPTGAVDPQGGDITPPVPENAS